MAYTPVGINAANIIFTATMPFFVRIEELYELLGPLQAVSLERCDGMPLGKGLPKQIVQSAKWPEFVVGTPNDSFRVIGFGQSFSVEKSLIASSNQSIFDVQRQSWERSLTIVWIYGIRGVL